MHTHKIKHFLAILNARNREFVRDYSSWAWNIFFPILLVIGLTFTFSEDNQEMFKVGVYPQVTTEEGFLETRYIKFVAVEDLNAAIVMVERHQLDLLMDPKDKKYWLNQSSPNGYVVEKMLYAVEGESYQKQLVDGREVRYIDWVVPGILAMNMMFSCLFGVGYVIVRYRKNGVLKRLKATPLSALEFLSAQVVSRLWLIMLITTAVFAASHYFLQFTMHGSLLDLFVLFMLGAICLISMGLLVAARTSSEELAGGLLNMATWPMMLLSGVWFSMQGAHPLLQKIALLFPLTHLVTGARAIMIDGATLLDLWPNVVTLIVMSLVMIVIGAWAFRWE